jgi:hypothetical protein
MALLGFLVFVLDQGVLLVARGQAQTAADAGALAGAVALSYDEVGVIPPATLGPAELSATSAANANLVWGEPATSEVTWVCPPGLAGPCTRVNIYRNGESGSNPLPTFLGPILGIESQRVRAMAVAESAPGNATNCERPFALPDPGLAVAQIGMHFGSALPPLTPATDPMDFGPGRYRLLDVWNGTAADVHSGVRVCPSATYGIDDVIPLAAAFAADYAGVVAGVQDIIDLDPLASWNAATKHVDDTCAETRTCTKYDANGNLVADPGRTVSPRVVALPVFDPATFGGASARVANHIGLFIDSVAAAVPGGEPQIQGYLVTMPGRIRGETPSPAADVAFLRVPRLVR